MWRPMLIIICVAIRINSQKCIFPFTYNGKEYQYCKEDNSRYWCSLDIVYTENWRYCNQDEELLARQSSQECIFPFTYDGKEYQYCKKFAYEDAYWCSLEKVYKNKWRRCNKDEEMLARQNHQTDLIYPGPNWIDNPRNRIHYKTRDVGDLFTEAVVTFLDDRCDVKEVLCGTYKAACVPPPAKTYACKPDGYRRYVCGSAVQDNILYTDESGPRLRPGPQCRFIHMLTNCAISHHTVLYDVVAVNFNDPNELKKCYSYINQWENVKKRLLSDVKQLKVFQYSGHFELITDWSASVVVIPATNQVIVAAAQLEEGRVIAFGHDDYPLYLLENSTLKLWQNIKQWLAPHVESRPSEPTVVVYVRNANDVEQIAWHSMIPKSSIIMWRIDSIIGRKNVERIVEFVARGGGLVIGIRGWYYNKHYHNIDDSELVILMAAIGLRMSPWASTATWDKRPKPIDLPLQVQLYRASSSLEYYKLPLQVQLYRASSSLEAFEQSLQMPDDMRNKEYFFNRLWPVQFKTMVRKIVVKFDALAQTLTPCLSRGTKPTPFVQIYNKLLHSQSLANSDIKAPGAFLFPGDLEYPYKVRATDAIIRPTVKNEYHSTGRYLLPGGTLMISLVGNAGNIKNIYEKFKFHIHGSSYDLRNTKPYKRWPRICDKEALINNATSVSLYSAFGGIVWIKNIDVVQATFLITGTIPTPTIDLRQRATIAEWDTRRQNPGLWADLAGDAIMFTVPSSAVRHLDSQQIEQVINIYDRCVKLGWHLLGKSPATERKMIIAPDVQILGGYMHAGYPIATHLDIVNPRFKDNYFVFNATYQQRNPNWGLMHEIGHNQQDSRWRYDSTTEVTCNVFALLCANDINNIPVFDLNSGWMEEKKIGKQLAEYFSKGADYQDLKANVWLHLAFFMHLQHTFGWELYRQFFRKFNKDGPNPNTDIEKRDLWLTLCSDITRLNLTPMFEFWGVVVSEQGTNDTNKWPTFLPDDDITMLAPMRVNQIKAAYPFLLRQAEKPDSIVGPPSWRVLNPDNRQPARVQFS